MTPGVAPGGLRRGTRYAELVPADDWTAAAAFQCAFAAVSYFAGTRDAAELLPFDVLTPAARRLSADLAATDRVLRAQALSRELGVIARALEERRLA